MENKMDLTSQSEQKKISRRKLMMYAWIGAAAVVVGELIGGTLAFLWPRRRGGKTESVFIAGKASDFRMGEVVDLRREKAFIVRLQEGFLALSAVCPHLRCIVNWNQVNKRFECPCHGAKFNEDGEVLEGPPPRPLDLLKLQIVEGKLVVDKTSPIERKKFDPSQIVKG